MTLAPGTRLGPYEVTAQIGALRARERLCQSPVERPQPDRWEF